MDTEADGLILAETDADGERLADGLTLPVNALIATALITQAALSAVQLIA